MGHIGACRKLMMLSTNILITCGFRRLLKEMGFIDKEEDLNDEAIAAFVKAFDKPLPPHVIAGLRCLTRLDDPASIPSDFAGQDGITTGTA
uniref:Uncharacterized protein n=1 Tax=Oryza barthii TaxID=65489 RepID=A0A0D3GCF2_9ORYZ